MDTINKTIIKQVKSQYYNPDPLVRLIGDANESTLHVNNYEVTALVDSGAQISTITEGFVKMLKLKPRSLKRLLKIEGTGGGQVPYKGYVEVKLRVPEVEDFYEDVLFLVIPNSDYGERVPVQLGTLHIDMLLDMATPEELAKLGKTWERGRVGRVLVNKQAQIGGFDLDSVKGVVRTAEGIRLKPGQSCRTAGKIRIRGNSRRLNLIIEDRKTKAEALQNISAVPVYTMCKAGSNRVMVMLVNNSSSSVYISRGRPVAEVSPANLVPNKIAPTHPEDQPVDAKAYAEAYADGSDEKKPAYAGTHSATIVSDEKERRELLRDKLNLEGYQNWDEDDQRRANQLFEDYHDIFALGSLELGKTSLVKHAIKLDNEQPFKERYRRIPPHQFEEVRKHLQEMEEIGAIRRSNSPWASPVVLVRKKDGSLRFCIDLRKLNSRTIKDAYSLPRIEESLDCLNGSKIFTSLDLKSGYWQVELDDASIPLTAFTVGPLGFYECVRMPFGLTNAPATFQRLMESCLGELHLNWCIIYLDDVIIFAKDPKEHLTRLEGVFKKLRAAGLKLKPSKCEFFKDQIAYLGHIVSKNGIATDPKKIRDVKDWPVPATVTDVRSFLGFTNYYRKFILRYAQISKPLHELTAGENAGKKNRPVNWTKEHQEAFDKLKCLSLEAPILAYANYRKPFRVYTDASERGLGAVLSQEQENGKEAAIAYASRTLSKSEKRYDPHKLEFLALKWAITDRFHEYLYGGRFEVYTDNNPLTYILTTAKLDATGQRWVAALGLYDFKIYYRSGKSNGNADALSRIPWTETDLSDASKLDEIVVKATMSGKWETMVPQGEMTIHSMAAQFFAPDYAPNMHVKEWIQLQQEDPAIKKAVELVERNELHDYKNQRQDPKELRALLRSRSYLTLIEGILHRTVQLGHQPKQVQQVVLPRKLRKRLVLACHDEMGHLGMDRVLLLLQDRVYWPGMHNDVRNHIRSCERCERFKLRPEREEIHQIETSYPLELVHVDFLTIGGKKDPRKDINVLVVTDHFTRYAQAYVTSSQTAVTAAKVLVDRFFYQYGWPTKLLTDQGPAFESKLFKSLLKEMQVRKIRTTPYRPQGNAQCERFNRTLLGMLGTLPSHLKCDWREWVSTMTHAYNSTVSRVTGYSPYLLMFGRIPRIPIDNELNLPNRYESSTPDKYVERLLNRLDEAFTRARKAIKRDAIQRKEYFDRNHRCHKIEEGDIVLVRRRNLDSNYKISDRWEEDPWQVVGQYKDFPVYIIKPIGESSGKERVLHRNMLHPARSTLPDEEEDLETADETVEETISETNPNSTEVHDSTEVLSKANMLMEEHFG